MTMWKEIIKTAIIGTERQPLALPQSSNATGTLLAQLDPNDRERTLLSAAALVLLHTQAGRVAATFAQPTMPQCEAEDLLPCSPQSAQHLSMILNGQYKEVLPEWLTALGARQRRVPEEYLPALLDAGRMQSALCPLIASVLGKRGVWLAQHNPEWSYVANTTDNSAWETGNRAARLAFLQKLRTEDPTQARELLSATWQQEPPEERAAFIETLRVNLSLADEPFLESALDDRRKEVRRVAADLLASLPDSALCQRMIERVQPLVTVTKKRSGQERLTVILPEECTKEMGRDGIEAKPPPGKGQKAWWLQQMLSLVPPTVWSTESEKTPSELLALTLRNEWQDTLIEGWITAAQRHSQREWIDPLLSLAFSQERYTNVSQLVATLPHEQKEHLLQQVLQQASPSQLSDPTYVVLPQCRHPWSEVLSRVVLEKLAQIPRWWHSGFLGIAACHVSPTIAENAAILFAEREPDNADLENFLQTLQFRHDMLKEINS